MGLLSVATASTRGSRCRCGCCSLFDLDILLCSTEQSGRARRGARRCPMSVYTTVTPEDLAGWLTRYAIGAVHEFEPIAAGIENTNYFVTADKGRYVLTLYERLPAEELPFYLNLIAHLASAGVRAPAPEPDRSGALWSVLNGKPAGLVARLDGAAVTDPGV